jgi:hypothetical protein
MSLITLTFLTGLDSAVNCCGRSNPVQSNPIQLLVIASLSPLSPMRPSSYHGVVLLAMRSGWRMRWLAEIRSRAAEARSSLKSRGLMCCAACSMLTRENTRIRLTGFTILRPWPGNQLGEGATSDIREGRFLKVLITNSTSQEEGWMSGGEMFSKVEGGVTDQSGPRADLGADFLQSRLPRSQVSRCLQLLWFWAGAGAGAGLMQRKLPGLARGLRIGAFACAGRAS